VTLTPIERVSIRHGQVAGRAFFWGSKRPVAILVEAHGREWRIELEPAPENESERT
jgi:hypothetical protein